jgi:hypothetical protein
LLLALLIALSLFFVTAWDGARGKWQPAVANQPQRATTPKQESRSNKSAPQTNRSTMKDYFNVNGGAGASAEGSTAQNGQTAIPPAGIFGVHTNPLQNDDDLKQPLTAIETDQSSSRLLSEDSSSSSHKQSLLFWNSLSRTESQNRLLGVKSTKPLSLARALPTTSLLMKKLGHILAVSSSAIFLLLVFPLLLNSAIGDAKQGKTDFAAFYSAAGFCVITLVLSIREILSHLYNWYAPDVQKFVVRILFMVPLYSVQSWLSLRFHGPARVYIDTLRDLYEAYVIQSFVYYLIELLGGEDRIAEILGRKDDHLGEHGRFMNKCFRMERWHMGRDFLLKVKHGVLQYVVIKTFLTLLTTFVLLPSGLYGEGTFSWDYAYAYLTIILNISVLYAMYCLVKLFHAVKSDLRSPVNWRPVGKFLCVKGVVFFTWWQSVGIYFLKSQGLIDDIGTWSGEDVANGLIDYLVCVEMTFFSIAHMFTFTYRDYLPEEMKGSGQRGLVGTLFAKIDKVRRKNTSSGRNSQSQETISHTALLDDDEEVIPCIDENGDIVQEGSYRPPTAGSAAFEKRDAPLSLREALWSSTVPRETLDDIKRLGVVAGVQGSFGRGRSAGVDRGIDINLPNINIAESI